MSTSTIRKAELSPLRDGRNRSGGPWRGRIADAHGTRKLCDCAGQIAAGRAEVPVDQCPGELRVRLVMGWVSFVEESLDDLEQRVDSSWEREPGSAYASVMAEPRLAAFHEPVFSSV